MDKEKIIMSLLEVRGYIINISHTIFINVIDTKKVSIIDNNNKKDITKYYLIFKALYNVTIILKYLKQQTKYYPILYSMTNFMYNRVNSLKESYDINCDKIRVEKRTKIGDKNMILSRFNSMTLSNAIDYLKTTEYDVPSNISGFMKFDIITDSKTISMKKYLLLYADPNKQFDNTLSNILEFNYSDVTFENGTKVKTVVFKKRPVTKVTDFEEVKDSHLNDLQQ